MFAKPRPSRTLAVALVVLAGTPGLKEAQACGGFFCQQVPIDQAGEQIIFRQDGNRVTAVILIQYAGEADDFSWVVPVAGIPELSTGSDLVFGPLELATRPQFVLETTGEPCPSFFDSALGGSGAPAAEDNDNGGGGGVDVLQRLAVGPFDVEVVASDDADALATWLEQNNYDLTDRGRDLIAPYVQAGMNFVAVRLRKDQGVGDIQPLIMRYDGDVASVPIRLTAVAAQPDMGVIVWMLGPSRAVPLNYLHVTPNYTRLNWYSGTVNAYATYQDLITAAMNEAGGQGFATDYAGTDVDYLSQLPSVDVFASALIGYSAIEDDAEFIAQLAAGFVFPQDKVLEILRRVLPLPEGEGEFIYQIPELLRMLVSAEQLASGRASALVELNESVIRPLQETLDVLDDGLYMTRLYTTLSADEMTLDPAFSFNPDLDDQQLDRHATLDIRCGGWSLTLGKGTGRDGERVIEAAGTPPGFLSLTVPTIEQEAVWRTEMVTIVGPPTVVTQKQFPIARIGDVTDGTGGQRLCGAGTECGAGVMGMLCLTLLGLRLMRCRR